MKSKEYIAVKNFIHNDLKLTKTELHSIIVEAVKDEAKAQVKLHMQQDPNLNQTVREQLFKEITNAVSGRSFDSSRNEFFRKIGEELVKQLNVSIKTQ